MNMLTKLNTSWPMMLCISNALEQSTNTPMRDGQEYSTVSKKNWLSKNIVYSKLKFLHISFKPQCMYTVGYPF